MSNQLIPDEDFQIVVPSENGLFTTRTLNTDAPSNNALLKDFQEIDNIPVIPVEHGTCFDLDNLPQFTSLRELLNNLCETMIRFDSTPMHYQKGDYEQLIKTITNSLIYLYKSASSNPGGAVITPFVGIAYPSTNPEQDALNLGNTRKGIYIADSPDDYLNFGVTLRTTNFVNNIVLLIPYYTLDGVFDSYEVYVHTIDMSNILPQNITTIYQKDASYINDHIRLLETNLKINVKKLTVRTSTGDIDIDAKVVYNDSVVYLYSEFLSKSANWEWFTIEYDILPNDKTYLPDLRGKIGRNYIQDEYVIYPEHSKNNRISFESVYTQFGGNTRQALESIQLIGDQIVSEKTDEYAVKYKFNLISRPYKNAAIGEDVSSCPDILTVASHYDNTDAHRNITSAPNVFLNNIIAISAGTNQDGTGLWTSYGNGVEFFESFNSAEIDIRYPTKSFKQDKLWYTTDLTYTTLKTTDDMNVGLYYSVGETLIWKKPDTSEIEVTILGINFDDHTLTFDTNFGEVLIANPVEIYRMITVGKAAQYWPAQSQTCSIIAAKLALIQDATDANWQVVREAARKTATNSTVEIIDGKNIYTTHWDEKRGFGIVDVSKAIAYINDNYINNQDYKDSAVPALPKYNSFLTLDDIDINNPVTKKQLQDCLAKQTLPISLTYSALYALKQANTLVVGQRYIISDYQTVHEIPNSGTWDEQNQVMSTNVINTGQVEPLLVTALTTNKLMNECYSTLFPEDIIYYDIENNQTMVEGCTKGYIYRRIDTIKQNDIGFDYRNVKFRRYQINVTTEHATGNATFTKGSVIKKTGTTEVYIKLNDADGLFSDTSKWKRFEWDNLMYVSPIGFNEGYSEYGWVLIDYPFQLKIPTTSNYNDYYFFSTEPTINGVQSSYDEIYQNKFKQDNSSLIFNSNSVFFGNNFNNNTVGDNFIYNIVGNYFQTNIVGNNFNNNTVGYSFNNNTVGDNFNNNIVGNDFNSNTVGHNFNNNTVGNGFQTNTVGDNFIYNIVGNYFQTNIVGNNFNRNGRINFSLVTYVYQSYNKELYTNKIGNPMIKYIDEFGDTIILDIDMIAPE